MLAAGDTQRAREAADELAATAAAHDSSGLEAAARQAQGAVLVAIGQYGEALRILRLAYQLWQEFPAPYDPARTRLLLAAAYDALGDNDAAALELDATQRVFDRLRATLDARRAAVLRGRPALPGGLTEREADVLRLVAAGLSNRDIATKLFLSDKTVARHLANIYAKLDPSSRTAAAAYAFQHGVVAPR